MLPKGEKPTDMKPFQAIDQVLGYNYGKKGLDGSAQSTESCMASSILQSYLPDVELVYQLNQEMRRAHENGNFDAAELIEDMGPGFKEQFLPSLSWLSTEQPDAFERWKKDKPWIEKKQRKRPRKQCNSADSAYKARAPSRKRVRRPPTTPKVKRKKPPEEAKEAQ